MRGVIKIRGARQHNLRGIDVDLPRGELVVITGVSGSGKSSLAFHTLFAEGQRRYVESLSIYARQFLDQLEKPAVDSIEGLSPAIAIEQRSGSGNPRSTIATVTEVHDYLRILYAGAGIPHDPETGERLNKMTSGDIVSALMAKPERTKVVLLAPIETVGGLEGLVQDLRRQGFVRVRAGGELLELEDLLARGLEEEEGLEIVVDRIVVKAEASSRLADSVEVALRICGAETKALVQEPGETEWQEVAFATSYRNPSTGFVLSELSPRCFSFNSPVGACEQCHGLGTEEFCDPRLVVPDESESLSEGAVRVWTKGSQKKKGWNQLQLEGLAKAMGFSLKVPFRELSEDAKEAIFYGTDEEMTFFWEKEGVKVPMTKAFEGICRQVERLFRETESDSVRRSTGKFMTSRPCQKCGGKRLKPEYLAVTLEHEEGEELGIHDFCALTVEEAAKWIKGVKVPKAFREPLGEVLAELSKRLEFLDEVGLGYLSMDRPSGTLSGGEQQRVRLATQLGARLAGVLYVLDEPSIGLHPADTEKLINALKGLRDLGNTVVVVEHDEEVVRAAEWVIEIGPGAGVHGGELLFAGTPAELENAETPSGAWLKGTAPKPETIRRKRKPGYELRVLGAKENNLRNLQIDIPLGLMVCVTGPSGSGKSTLVDSILKKALARHFHRAKEVPGAHQGIEGLEHLEKLVVVDQSPLGKSPRSNPATYTGAFDLIRELYAKLPLSRQRGYGPGRFSFNIKGGRCEACQGAGVVKIDMHFLPDVFVPCQACGGARYNRETLEVLYRGKNIGEVLDLTVSEACGFFGKVPKLSAILESLQKVGLGYLALGQAANTLSGGEAQRVKLACELAKPAPGPTLYLLDEPTTGLHFQDVQVLLKVLFELRDAGHSLVVVEHQLDVIAAADWIIDLGPGGGSRGGKLVAEGPPKKIQAVKDSLTGRALAVREESTKQRIQLKVEP